jgi:hypothetical protein
MFCFVAKKDLCQSWHRQATYDRTNVKPLKSAWRFRKIAPDDKDAYGVCERLNDHAGRIIVQNPTLSTFSWPSVETKTHCPYCALQCGTLLTSSEEGIIVIGNPRVWYTASTQRRRTRCQLSSLSYNRTHACTLSIRHTDKACRAFARHGLRTLCRDPSQHGPTLWSERWRYGQNQYQARGQRRQIKGHRQYT